MTRYYFIALCFVFVISPTLLSACSAERSEPPLSNTQVKEQAQTAFADYVSALNRGDYDSAALIYDRGPDFHWIERGGVQYTSGAEAAASLKAFEGQSGRANMTTDQMLVTYLSPTSALISTHFNFEMIGTNEQTQFAFDGWMSVAMVKREEVWVFAAGQVGPGETP